MDALGLESSDSEEEENEVLSSFVKAYGDSPVLWNPAHEHYLNKTKRNEALRKLARIYRRIHPYATNNDVKVKINSMRSNYRKELAKIETSRRLGCSAADCYKPSSWYFYALHFVNELEQPAGTTSMVGNEVRSAKPPDDAGVSTREDAPVKPPPTDTPLPRKSSSGAMRAVPPNKKLRAMDLMTRQNDLLQQLSEHLERAQQPQNQVPTIVKAWIEQLVALESHQRIFAEKAISDILFEASLGTLNRYSIQINIEDNGISHEDMDTIIHDP